MSKKFKVPDTYVLVFLFIVLATVLTYIIPAGVYGTIEGTNTLDPNAYQRVEQTPVSIMDFLQSIPQGLTKSASTIFFLFLVGGYLEIINATGAIDSFIAVLIKKLGDKSLLIIPIVMIVMCILGALGIVVNTVIAFIPIGIVLAKRLKVDAIFAVAIMYLSSYIGFAATPIGATNLQLAQSLADVELLSGFGFRSIALVILLTLTIWYTTRYAKKVSQDNSLSILGSDRFSGNDDEVDTIPFTGKLVAVLVAFFGGFTIYTYGALEHSWGTDYLTGILLAVALFSGLISGMNPDTIAKHFVNGCKGMVYGAILIGFASAITTILTNGQVVNTIIYYLAMPLTAVPQVISAVLMFLINLVFNFFVPSGSGQAAIVMPLMSPLSDIVGVSRQIAVLAYQYGDGLSNTIIPTSGTLMGVLGCANIPLDKWLKFQLPLFGMQVGLTMIIMIVAVSIGLV